MSNTLRQLRERSAELKTRGQAILERAKTEGRSTLTADEAAEAARIRADRSAVTQQIDRIVDDMLGQRSSTPTTANARTGASLIPSWREFEDKRSQQRALGSGASSGGVLLDTEQAELWFDRLRNRSVFLAANPRTVTVGEHAARYPIITSSVTVAARNDTEAITPTDPGLDSLTLEPVSYAAMTIVSNEVLKDSNGQAREIVEADLLRQCATKLDADMFNGTGAVSPHRIYGLLNVAGIETIGAAGPLTLDLLLEVQATLEANGADRDRIAYFLTPADWAVIRGVKDLQDRYLLMPDLATDATPSLFGSRVYVSANVPTASALAVDLDQVVVGIGEDVSLAYSEDFAFDKNSTAIRLTTRVDLGVINPEAVHAITGITA